MFRCVALLSCSQSSEFRIVSSTLLFRLYVRYSAGGKAEALSALLVPLIDSVCTEEDRDETRGGGRSRESRRTSVMKSLSSFATSEQGATETTGRHVPPRLPAFNKWVISILSHSFVFVGQLVAIATFYLYVGLRTCISDIKQILT